MRDRIEAVIGVESLVDALRKFNPNVRQDDPYGRGAKAVAVGGALLTEARKKLKEAEKKLDRLKRRLLVLKNKRHQLSRPLLTGLRRLNLKCLWNPLMTRNHYWIQLNRRIMVVRGRKQVLGV